MGTMFLIQTFGPVLLGLIFSLSGLLSAKPLWLGRAAFLLCQLELIYAFGFGSVLGLSLIVCVLLGFVLFSSHPKATPRSRVSGSIAFFALFIAYWALQKYLVPLWIAPAAAASVPMSHIRDATALIEIVGVSYIGFKFIQVYLDYRAVEIQNFEPLSFLSWLFFFPSIIAGPMQRYQSWEEQFGQTPLTFDDALWGIRRILLGLLLKVVIADSIHGLTLPGMTSGTLSIASWSTIALSALIYTAYLYLDFSGYCHIAIGTGVFWGIRLPENFNKPYISRNLAEFWNRWHITLSEILRDYLFYPLSLEVKRLSAFQKHRTTAIALPPIITFVLAGIWHGAGLNFVLFGLIHGVGLAFIAIRRGQRRVLSKTEVKFWSAESALRRWCSTAFTYVYVSFSFVFFSLPTERLAILGRRLIGH